MRVFKFIVYMLPMIVMGACTQNNRWCIQENQRSILLQAGILCEEIAPVAPLQVRMTVGAEQAISVNNVFSFALWKASPNEIPQGIDASAAGVEMSDTEKNQTDALNVARKIQEDNGQATHWEDSLAVNSSTINYQVVSHSVEETLSGKRLTLTCKINAATPYEGLLFDLVYQIYTDYPVIRKWMVFRNEGATWMKLTNLNLVTQNWSATYPMITHLTPLDKEIDPAIVAYSDPTASQGMIVSTEVPSRLRINSDQGETGYHPDYFEWVLGPGEAFTTEPVSFYAFDGESQKTVSAVSTVLDRTVESEFRCFLKKFVLLPQGKYVAPVFCTWTNYSANINDRNMYQAADIAEAIGFKTFQLDAGWSDPGPNGGWASTCRQPNTKNFADLKSFSQYLKQKGMGLGLWYSVFVNEIQTLGKKESPVVYNIPMVRRAGGLGLSFAYDKARKLYADDLIYLNKTYDAVYFKQDLSNICYGDLAKGHESRTLKESYLRGLRGLFETQDQIRAAAPDAYLQLSHEIYWETAGPAADIAVLQHANTYHIPPNEYWGAGNRSNMVEDAWAMDADSLRTKLIEGCARARQLLYSHRGLPLERLEVFGCSTTNYYGSLTTDVQDRQICSWLMGVPSSYSGDLTSLTEENVKRYHDRFALLAYLQDTYGIYGHYQYSGVPAPTDTDWHWWGKLNEKGSGAVIIMRGTEGADCRQINIPWVDPKTTYQVKGHISGIDYGSFSGIQLQEGILELSLPRLGQEILEIMISCEKK